MNKKELIAAVAAESGLNKAKSKLVLNAVLNAISTTLKDGGKVELQGWGTFKLVLHKERTVVNPQTKKPMIVQAKEVVKFKASKNMISSNQC